MSKEIILSFIKNINEQNTNGLAGLMTEDHTFIDAHENIMNGKETMRKGWIGYFSIFPDYKIEITDLYEYGNTFVMFGYASGTYKGNNPDTNYWRLPAAWKAIVHGGKLKLWQVYCDTKVPFDIMEENK